MRTEIILGMNVDIFASVRGEQALHLENLADAFLMVVIPLALALDEALGFTDISRHP